MTQHDKNRNFNWKVDLTGDTVIGNDVLSQVIKLELFEKKYCFTSSSVGTATIPLTLLKGVLSVEDTVTFARQSETVTVHYRLDIKCHVDQKVSIKQFTVEKIYPIYDIRQSDEVPGVETVAQQGNSGKGDVLQESNDKSNHEIK